MFRRDGADGASCRGRRAAYELLGGILAVARTPRGVVGVGLEAPRGGMGGGGGGSGAIHGCGAASPLSANGDAYRDMFRGKAG